MKSIDLGTMFLVKGELDIASDDPEFTVERNCFLKAASTEDTEDTLRENNWAYAKHGNDFYILGEDAIKLKNLLTISGKDENIVVTKIGELRRPMKHGILNTGEEKLSVAIIQKLIANLLGKPNHKDEVICFCAPGDPVDRNMTVVFHRTMITNFLKALGYKVECIPEALAIIFSQHPTAEDEDGSEYSLTGIAFSFGAGMANVCFALKKMPLINFSIAQCIPPGNKVITQKGLLNIEDIAVDDLVLNKIGLWAPVSNTQSKEFRGNIYKFQAIGQGQWSTTGDHRLWIKPVDEQEWSWADADEVCVGDKVMQPWMDTYETKHTIGWTRENTKEYMNINMFSDQYYLMGRFLGDGSVFKDRKCDRGIKIALNRNSPIRQEFLKSIMESTFQRNVEVCEDGSVILLKLHDSGLAKWFRKTCYTPNLHGDWMDKAFPWDIYHLKENYLRFFIAGLLDSDGYVDEAKNKIYLGITSPSLAQAFYLSLMKIGLKPTINWRTRDDSHEYQGKIIKHKREIFEITAAGAKCKEFIGWFRAEKLETFFDKSEIYGYNIAKITSIKKEQYNGKVYDLSVDDQYNSFCLPGCVVHNSGDWIDEEAAKVAGINVSAMTRFKETSFDLETVDYNDIRQAALDIFYQNMIEHTLVNFAEKFNQLDIPIAMPLEIVIAGGTASVPGFLGKFKAIISGLELPFKIKDIRMAKDPFYAVSHGCLLKAINLENKMKKSKQENKQDEPSPKAKLK